MKTITIILFATALWSQGKPNLPGGPVTQAADGSVTVGTTVLDPVLGITTFAITTVSLVTGAPAANGTFKGSIVAYDPSTLGTELAASDAACTGWTLGAGWSCSSGVITHTSGTATAHLAVYPAGGWIVHLVYTVTGRTAGSVTPKSGGTSGAPNSTNVAQVVDLVDAIEDDLLTLTPTTDFNGSINVATGLSLKQVKGGAITAAGGFALPGNAFQVLPTGEVRMDLYGNGSFRATRAAGGNYVSYALGTEALVAWEIGLRAASGGIHFYDDVFGGDRMFIDDLAGTVNILAQENVSGLSSVGAGPSALTTVTDNPLSSWATTANVVSTTGYPTSGVLLMQSEAMKYTGVTATSFTGLTRGWLGTVGASHATGTSVDAYLFVAENSTSLPKFVCLAGGNCGIGTSHPTAKLEIANSLFLNPGSVFLPNAQGIWMNGLNNYGSGIQSDAGGTVLELFAGSAQRVTINANGTVALSSLTSTGAATGKTVVCVDTATGIMYASSSGVACAN